MKLAKINLMQFDLGAALDFHNHIADFFSEFFTEKHPDALINYFTAIREYQEVVEDIEGDEDLFKEIHVADLALDNDWRGLKAQVLVACYCPDEEVSKAGEAVDAVLSTHENPLLQPFSSQHGVISQALTELLELPKEVLRESGVDYWLDILDRDFDKFTEIFAQRMQGVADDVAANCREKRLAMQLAYYKVMEDLTARIIVFGEEEYADLVEKLNSYILQKRSEYKNQ